DKHRLGLREQVDVTRQQRRSRKDGNRPLCSQQDLESVSRNQVPALHELIRIRRGGEHHESSRKLADFSSEDGRRVTLDDDRRTPRRAVRLHQTRYITEETTVITAYVRVEGIVHIRQRIRTKGVIDGHLPDPEIV